MTKDIDFPYPLYHFAFFNIASVVRIWALKLLAKLIILFFDCAMFKTFGLC